MYLQALACAVPDARFSQTELWPRYRDSVHRPRLRAFSNHLIESILTKDNGIDFRHFALGELDNIYTLDPESLNHAFEREAPALSSRALQQALGLLDLGPGAIDALFICTCTGYLCPGPSSFVAETLGLRSDAYLADIVGMGCGAAIPTMRAAHGYLAAHPGHRVAVIAVEICSAAFFLDDSGDVIISACLFGDGAAAAIFSGIPPAEGPAWQFSDFSTIHLPAQREILRFVNQGGRLRNKLDRTVPALAGEAVAKLWQALPENESSMRVIPHSGGREVLNALVDALEIEDFPESRWVLRHGGNMSSPSVLFSLAAQLQGTSSPLPTLLPENWGPAPALGAPAENIWLTSFGAGFSAHSCSARRNG